MPDSQKFKNQLAEEKLSLSAQESELSTDMVDNAEQGMVLQLADGTISACNRAAQNILGLTAEEIIGETNLGFGRELICENGSFPEDAHPAMVALKTGKPCVNVVCGFYQRNGELVWLLLDSQPLFQKEGTTPYAVVTTFSDITASKRRSGENENILRLSGINELQDTGLFAQIAEAMPGLVYIYDLVEQRNVYINRQVVEILGYTREQIQATRLESLFQLLHPDDLERHAAHLSSLKSAVDGEVLSFEFQYRHANGKWRWFSACETVFSRTELGEAQLILGIAQDITERRRIEAALRQSNERFELATAAVNCLIYDWDIERDTVERTCGLTELFGYSREEVEENGEWWRSLVHPNDQNRAKDEFLASLSLGNRFCTEYRVRHKNGRYLWVEDQGVAVRDQNGRLVRIVGSTTDISDRKQFESALRHSEERYRLLANAIPEMVWITDAEGMTNYVNQRWYEYTGLTPEETAGYGWQRALHPDDLEVSIQRWQEASQNGTYENEQRYKRAADNTYRWHLVRAFPLKDDGRIVKWLGTCTDIHAQKQLEEERIVMLEREKAARAEAETANRIKDQFLAILSHELRSPLNPILGWTKLLKTRKFDQTATIRALDTIERNANLQIQLIDELLDVSRILRNKLSLNVATVDLTSVIDAALETVRLTAEAKSLDLKFSISNQHSDNLKSNPPLSPLKKGGIQNPKFLVEGDAYRLQQVVGNLLTNAVKFTPSGGSVEVCLKAVIQADETEEEFSESKYAQITVKDTGPGISREFLPYIFEYFRQADTSTTRKFGGLGLGLAIVRHLVELHGGSVAADSPGEGQGATFTVRLPLINTPEMSDEKDLQPVSNLNLEDVKILIVDDNSDAREFISFLVEQYGAKATVAASVTEACAILAKSQPDLLISDLGMPQEDGYSLIRFLRGMSADRGGLVPAIALTAYAGESDRDRVLAAGFQKHLAKPVEPDILLASIADLLS